MNHLKNIIISIFALTATLTHGEGEWIELFDGKTLKGWKQKFGYAPYEVKDGAIIGTTIKDSPNSFLCTERRFSDFELQIEVKFIGSFNSGIQIRSNRFASTHEKHPHRVNGPQVELTPTRANGVARSGYIWSEANGKYGWFNQNKNAVNKQFINGEWNKFRIVAEGPRIRVWINGVLVEDVTHEEAYKEYHEGFIGLQVHAIRNWTEPASIAWKNIRIKEL